MPHNCDVYCSSNVVKLHQAKSSFTTIGGQMPRPGETHRIVDSTWWRRFCVPDFIIVRAKIISPGVSCKTRFNSNSPSERCLFSEEHITGSTMQNADAMFQFQTKRDIHPSRQTRYWASAWGFQEIVLNKISVRLSDKKNAFWTQQDAKLIMINSNSSSWI